MNNNDFFDFVKEPESQLTIYIIGYYMNWHHCKHLVEYLKSTKKYNIIQYELKDLNKIIDSVYEIEISKKSIVLVFQLDVIVKVIKKTFDPTDIKVINYNAETYYPPGCINPDFLLTAYPEMIERYKKMNPLVFLTTKFCGYIPIFVNPKRFDFTCAKFIKGIHFKGVLKTKTGSINSYNGGGRFRLYRDAYKERYEFITENNDLINYHEPDYGGDGSNYDQWISTVEASIVSNAYLSYFSKRPFENACAGAINIFYVRDVYESRCIKEIGFKHLVNCIFVRKREDLAIFQKLSEEEKKDMREKAYKLVMKNYTTERFWHNLLRLIK